MNVMSLLCGFLITLCVVYAYLILGTCIYTVSHKKRATLFLIITTAFLGRFLYFLYQ